MMKITAQTIGQSMKTLTAAARGSRQCWCQGQLLVMLGHYGWILPLDDSVVNHPAAAKTDGKIYLHKRDIVGGAQLAEGDMLGFYLYVDEQGLGAEEALRLEEAGKMSFNAEAKEFVPPPPGMESSWSVNAKSQGMHASAKEFVPAEPIKDRSAADMSPWSKKESNSHKGRFYYINSKTGKTSWTRPDDYVEPIVPKLTSVSAINLAYLCDDSSDDDDTDYEDTPVLVSGKQARQRSLSPAASTSAGLSSEDELSSEDDAPAAEELPEACLGGQKFRAPPGLDLPPLPSSLALGVLARAGLSVDSWPSLPKQQKLPAWRSTRTSKLTSLVPESTKWNSPWRRDTSVPVAAA